MSQDTNVDLLQKTGRIVAIAHRVKARRVNGEMVAALPTKVLIDEGGERTFLELSTEADELDFVNHKFGGKKSTSSGSEEFIGYQGLQANDTVLMILGGSGDPLAYAISRKGESVGFSLWRMPGWALKAIRGDKPSEQSARDQSELVTLVDSWKAKVGLFYQCDPVDRERIEVANYYKIFKEAQLARMGQASRTRQSLVGKIFMALDGLYPEGVMKKVLKEFSVTIKGLLFKGSRPVEILLALDSAEKTAKTELEKSVTSSRYWQLFLPVVGIGPSIAGAFIAHIGDMRKFENEAKLWAFAGLHTLKANGTKFQQGDSPQGGIMARRRKGQLSNWNPSIKQALFTLGDQFNRRQDSYWGIKLRENKVLYRTKYPEVVRNEAGKMRYNDMHIHKMALWKTLRQFTRWMYREWTRLENDPNYVVRQPWEIHGPIALEKRAA